MALDEYANWQSRRQNAGKPTPRAAAPTTTVPSQEGAWTATRGAGLQVQEHAPATTTIVQRLYASLGKRR